MATRKASRAETPPAEPAFPKPGFRIGEYVIENMLGHGSMSTVFLARDATNHEVALKVFQESPNVSEVMRERFRREVEASKQLRSHPNILTVYATGQDGPSHYIAMQPVLGSQTVEVLMEQEVLSIDRVVRIFIKIARALAFAHHHRIMHRDVKPSNIMIDPFGEPLLADFGVAALLEWPRFTVPGALTGTPLYMSPEQARGEPLDTTSDLYSMAVVLYEALTGVLPYSTHRFSAVQDTLRAVQNEQVRRPRLFREEIPPELEAVVLKALAREPADRYPDGDALADELQRVLDGKPVQAPLYSRWDTYGQRVRRHRRPLVIFAAAIGVLLAVMAYFLSLIRDVQFQQLVGLARLQSSQYKLERLARSGDAPLASAPAHPEVRLARMEMSRNEWAAAMPRLRTALDESREQGDARGQTLALIELARCAIMLGDPATAREYYRAIFALPEASASILALAQLDSTVLAIREGRADDVAGILATREIPAANPVTDALSIVGGGPEELAQVLSRIARLPEYLYNDTYLAAAMMADHRGNRDQAREYLRRCIALSRPASEWPGPFAERILQELPP